MKKIIIFVFAALTFTGCKSDDAESILNDTPKLTVAFGSNNLAFDDPGLAYLFFNDTSQNPSIFVSGYDQNSDIQINFNAYKLTPKVSSVKLSGKDTSLFIQFKTNFNNIPEIWYNEYGTGKTTENVEVTDFEYRDNGKIKGVINAVMIGYSGTNKGKRINIQIAFGGRYNAN